MRGGEIGDAALLEEMSARSGRPVMIAALLHNPMNPQAVFKDLDAISAANDRGRKLIGQVSCCPLTMDFTLASPYPVEGLASWKPALGAQGVALKAVLAHKSFRDGVRAELAAPAVFRLFNGEWVTAMRGGEIGDAALLEFAMPRVDGFDHMDLVPLAVEEAEHRRRRQLGAHGIAETFVGEHGFQRRALHAERGLPAHQAFDRVR